MRTATRYRRFLLALAFAALLYFSITPIVSADTTYVVQRGDILSRIALRFGVTTVEIARANNITNPDRIYAGQVLIIPEKQTEPPLPEDPGGTQTASPTIPSQSGPASTTYVIQRGDTLFRIAKRFGVTTQVLASVNGIWDPSRIYAGQVLSIPSSIDGSADSANALPIAPISYGERWIDVDLTSQRLIAYEDTTPVYSTPISSGLWPHQTVTGLFKVYLRYQSQTMNGYRLGYDYYLTNVPFVMYFYRDYAIHGTYWHNNFGNPMSHGCVNTPTPAAQWLYTWSSHGTPVYVHY